MIEGLNSLCMIWASEKGLGCGAFISPRHVLTNFHMVTGAANVTVVSADKQRCSDLKRKKFGGKHFGSKANDLAVFELQDPIGADYSPVNLLGDKPFPYGLKATGFLGSAFNGMVQSHGVNFDLPGWGENRRLDVAWSYAMLFRSRLKGRPGYSGSPILGPDGKTIISLLHGGSEDLQVREEMHFRATKKTPNHHFLGTDLNVFSNFMNDANEALDFTG